MASLLLSYFLKGNRQENTSSIYTNCTGCKLDDNLLYDMCTRIDDIILIYFMHTHT